MAFHVTQCPSCESTFSTSARLLESAAGRVRCGACLAVFQATDNLVFQHSDDSAEHDGESVFVGNNPLDYFDPSSFLTRSALQERGEQEQQATVEMEVSESPISPSEATQLSKPELPDIESEEFFAAVSASDADPVNEATAIEVEDLFAEVADSNSIPEFAVDTSEETEQAADVEPSIEHWGHEQEEKDEEDADSLAGMQNFPEFEITESEIPAPTNHEYAYDQPYTLEEFADKANTEVSPVDEPLIDPASAHEPAAETETWSETVTISEPAAYKESSPYDAVRIISISDVPQEPDYSDPLEQQLNHEITELDFQETVADGLNATEFETALFGDTYENPDFDTIAENSASDDQLFSPTGSAVVNFADETVPVEHEDAELAIGGIKAAEPTDELAQDAEIAAEDSTEAIRARVRKSGLTDDEALEAIPEENLAVLRQFSTPVELLAGMERHWGRLIGLSLLFLMLSATFAGQYLWRHMSLYSQVAQVRPLFEAACTWLECELPTYSNIAEIRSDNLAVRSHPELANGLVVNIEFRNTADFPQPFPVLILSFNSASNEIVALREFEPQEYLEPALQSFNLMPVQSPVQITMEIIDPGPGAVNYTLAFRSP